MSQVNGKPTSVTTDGLERLIVALQASGYQARLFTPVGKVAYVRVRNPDAAALTEIVYAQDGSFWHLTGVPTAYVEDPDGATWSYHNEQWVKD